LKDLSSVFDPWAAHRGLPWFELEVPWNEHPRGKWYWTTDGLGLRRDREPSATAPALRVVVTGDSHTDGVCDNEDSFCTLAELELASRRPGESIEVINAGRSRSSFANDLGVLERMLALEADVFVMVVYGGNDFAEALVWERLVQGMPWPERTQAELDRAAAALALHPAAVVQAFGQLDTLSRSEVARSTSSIAPAEAGAGGEFDARVGVRYRAGLDVRRIGELGPWQLRTGGDGCRAVPGSSDAPDARRVLVLGGGAVDSARDDAARLPAALVAAWSRLHPRSPLRVRDASHGSSTLATHAASLA